MDRPWTTGFHKQPATGPVGVTELGLAGDGQADLVNHGGPDKAICVYPMEHYAGWREELGITLGHAAFGENFTSHGLVESGVCIGDVFQCGALTVQISQPRQPCWKLARRWRIKDLAARVDRTGRSGWYFRVLQAGSIEKGDVLTLVERGHPCWTIAEANQVMHHRKDDLSAAAALARCPALSSSWKSSLELRVGKGIAPDRPDRLQDPALD